MLGLPFINSGKSFLDFWVVLTKKYATITKVRANTITAAMLSNLFKKFIFEVVCDLILVLKL